MSPIADEPADPNLWLEDIHGAEALAWAAERTAATEARFASDWRTSLEQRLRGILDDPARLRLDPGLDGPDAPALDRDVDPGAPVRQAGVTDEKIESHRGLLSAVP